jgi:uncharacterized protein
MTDSDTGAAPLSGGAESSAPTVAWIGPFVVFACWLFLGKYVPLANPAKEIVRDAVVLVSIVGFSRRLIPVSAPRWLSSMTIGVGVCVLWVAPDVLIPGWRSGAVFQNAVTGSVTISIDPGDLTPLMLVLRTTRAALLVPVLEELFWRGWLPRFLQDADFRRIPLGQYTSFAFWATAALFAAEHGPFWEVGLMAGVVYNWWMRRTRSLGDLVLCHATTNLALSLFVIVTKRWGFWM